MFVLVFAGNVNAQITNLTDRELLIQVYTKMETIEKSIAKMADSYDSMESSMNLLEKRVTKNEISIATFCEKIDTMSASWYWLLGLFFTFISGIFLIIYKKFWNGNKKVAN